MEEESESTNLMEFYTLILNEDSEDNKKKFKKYLKNKEKYSINKFDLQAALIICCLCNNPYYIERLLKEDIDINFIDDDHCSALMTFSESNNDTKTLRLLLEHGANPLIENKKKENSIKIAKDKQNNKVAEMLEKYTQALLLLAPKYNKKHTKSNLRHIPPELSRKVIDFLF